MPFNNPYHFSGQKADEQIMLVVRRHWFDIFKSLFPIIAVGFFLFFSYFFLPIYIPILAQTGFSRIFLFLENLAWMVIFIVFFLTWVDAYFDVWVVTTKRIVNAEQKGLFSRSVSELELDKIQDVTMEVLGIIPTFLNYGNVYVQTAGEHERFIFADVPDPYRIKDLIMSLQKQGEQKERRDFGEIIREEIHKDEV